MVADVVKQWFEGIAEGAIRIMTLDQMTWRERWWYFLENLRRTIQCKKTLSTVLHFPEPLPVTLFLLRGVVSL
jgi:hypothetical protein